MAYCQIGYVPMERRFSFNKEITDYAFRVLAQLKALAEWKDRPTPKMIGKTAMIFNKGEGNFSQIKLATEMGKCPKAIRLALRELEFKKLISWSANEYGTFFRILKDAIQKTPFLSRGGVGREAQEIKSRSSYKDLYLIKDRSHTSLEPPKPQTMVSRKVFFGGVEVEATPELWQLMKGKAVTEEDIDSGYEEEWE